MAYMNEEYALRALVEAERRRLGLDREGDTKEETA